MTSVKPFLCDPNQSSSSQNLSMSCCITRAVKCLQCRCELSDDKQLYSFAGVCFDICTRQLAIVGIVENFGCEIFKVRVVIFTAKNKTFALKNELSTLNGVRFRHTAIVLTQSPPRSLSQRLFWEQICPTPILIPMKK